SPGQWVLGPGAGTQSVSAKIFGSDIPKVIISATAVNEEEILTTQSVPSSGGTITVNKPGSPFHNTQLVFDDGTVPASTTITLIEVPTTGFDLPQGTVALTPALEISATAAGLQGGALVRLPATPVAGKVLMIGVANTSTGMVTVLPPVSADATSITALLASLDASQVGGVRAGAGLRAEPSIAVFMMGIDETR